MKLLISFLILQVISLPLAGQDHSRGIENSNSKLSVTQWKQDIDFLQKEILRLHPDPFYKNNDLDRAKFDQLFNTLRDNLSVWNENKIIAETARIIGLVRDGHTSVDWFASAPDFYDFQFFPLFLYYFPDGLYAIGAAEPNKGIIGKKLVAIDQTSVDEVIKRLRPIIPADYGNETAMKDGMRNVTIIPQLLHGLKVISNPLEATYSFVDQNGVVTKVKLSAGNRQGLFSAFDMSGNEGKPLYRQNPMKYYWHRWLEKEKTLYIKHTFQMVDKNYSPEAFCKDLQNEVDTRNPSKIILDLRQGQGGNIGTLKPLYNFLVQPKVNQHGKLYVLMDRRAQSAGTVLAIRLSMISKALLIGEPAVSAVNFFDNDRKFALPNSKIRVGISTHFQTAGLPVDSRIEFPADIPMEVTAKDYFANKDPLLDYALEHKVNDLRGQEIDHDMRSLYKYSALQVLEIKKVNDEWRMIIEDGDNVNFMNTTLYVGDNRLTTDIAWLTVGLENGKLVLHTPWGVMRLDRLPTGYQPPQKLVQQGKVDEAVAETKKSFSSVSKLEWREFEAQVNAWGYLLFRKKDFSGATKLFILNTELFPQSANTWDSLGEVYAEAGNRSEAIRCYKKALEVAPGLISATKALEKLK